MAYKVHPKYPLVVLANRDEYYARPTQNAHWWDSEPNLLAGKDLKAGGTWLGVNELGKFCALTNYREPSTFNPTAASRGKIVSNYLQENNSIDTYYQEQLQDVNIYNDFNLVCFENESLYYYGSKSKEFKQLEAGVYGLSNALLDSEWPKVNRGKEDLKALMEKDTISSDDGFKILSNPTIASDSELPNTGISLEFERMLSAMHIKVEGYGTRSSNVILYQNDKISFYEKNHLNGSSNNFEVKIRTNSFF